MVTQCDQAALQELLQLLQIQPDADKCAAINSVLQKAVAELAQQKINGRNLDCITQGWGFVNEIVERPIRAGKDRTAWFVNVSLICGTRQTHPGDLLIQDDVELRVASNLEPMVKVLNEMGGAKPFGKEMVKLTIRSQYSSPFSGQRKVLVKTRGVLEEIVLD